MDSWSFIVDLEKANQEVLSRLEAASILGVESGEGPAISRLLKVALKNELEASELAARWMPTTKELDVKLALARQVGDEAKHYNLIEKRLRDMGEDLSGFSPLEGTPSPLYQYLFTLTDTVERVAAAQFTREAIAIVKNQQFIAYCEGLGDWETARLYRETIQPDENYHVGLGRRMLERYATTPEAQERARAAAARTLELAEELQGVAISKLGLTHAPGC